MIKVNGSHLAYRHNLEAGFTIVELMVVVIVLTILLVVVGRSSYGYQASSRDRERANDIDAISRSLEQYYRTQSVATGATYPSSTITPAGIASIVGDVDIVAAPDEPTNSVVVATSGATQTPTVSQYLYQPLNVDGTICTASPCPRYKLYSRLEESSEILTINSLRQQ